MFLTAAQLSRLRTRPHRTRLWLGIYQPTVIFQGRINQLGVAKGDRVITLDETSGDFALIQGDETCFISTVSGGNELGRIRVRSATATTLTLAENAISWVNDWYLTVVRYFEPWGVYPRVTLDGNNDPTFFKDFDISYTNQNTVLDPVICLGPNHAGFLEPDGIATGVHQVWYTSSGTFDPTEGAANITGSIFDWHFEGGDPTGSADIDPGYVSYTGCGQFVTSLSVTTAGGATYTGRRHIQILTRPDQPGSCKPFFRWGLRSLEGNRDAGGYNARIWVRDVVDTDVIVDGAMVVVFSEDWEGGTNVGITGSYVKVGANAENRDQILFTGYILEDSIRLDPITSQVDFKAGSITQRMSELTTFSIALDAEDNGEPWTVFPSLTTDRAVIHYLRWHSTVLSVADFSQTGDTKRLFGTTMGRGNLYEAINGEYFSDLLGGVVSDRQGKIWAEIDANVVPTGSTRQNDDHMQAVIQLTRQDWRSQIRIERDPHADLSYVEVGGVAYSGPTTGTFDAFLSGAPGEAPDYFGKAERLSGLALTGQDQANELSGNLWASRTALFPKVQIPIAGDYRFIDIAPQHRVEITIAEGETFRHVEFTNKPFIPQAINYRWDARNQALMMDLAVKEETDGPPGDTVEIPVNPPYDRLILPDWDIDFPPIIPPDPIEPPIFPPPGTGDLVYLLTTSRLSRCRDFASGRATGSTWENITPRWETSGPGGPGTPGGVTGTMRSFRLDPQDPLNTGYLLTQQTANPRGPNLYRINNLDGITGTQSYTQILSPEQADDIIPATSETDTNDFGVSAINSNVIFYQGKETNLGAPIMLLRTNDGGLNWVNVEGDIDQQQTNVGFIRPSEKAIQVVFTLANLGRNLYQSNVQGTVWTLIRSNAGNPIHNVHVPFNENPADRIVYAVLSDSNQMILTKDLFATETIIGPVSFDGLLWRPPNIGGSNQPEYIFFTTWYLDRLKVAGLFRSITGGRNRIFYSTDGLDGGVNSWTPRFEFPNAGGGNIANVFEWHKTNRNIMAVTVDGDSDNLWLSTDEGFSFIDGIAKWEAGEGLGTTGSPDFLGWVVRSFRFVSLV